MTLTNVAGQKVRATKESVLSAIQDFADNPSAFELVNGPVYFYR